MTNSNNSHTHKILLTTLTLLFLTGFSAATASSLSLDSSLVAPGDSISGSFDVNDQNTDVQIALDVDQNGQYDSATDTTTTVSSSDISSDTGVTFNSLNVPSGASVGTADVVVIQQSTALSDGDDLSSPDDSTTATIDDEAPTLDSATRNSDTKIDLTVSDNNDVDEGSIVKEDLQLSTGSISSIDVTDSGSNAEVTITLTEAVDASSVDVSLQSNDGIKDVAGNTLSDGEETPVTANNMDGVAPTLDSASSVDTTTIEATISDGVDVDESTISASDFSLSSGTIDGSVTTSESEGTTTVTINLQDKVETSSVDVSIASGETISDTSGNQLTDSASPVTANDMDGVAPDVTGMTLEEQTDPNGIVKDGDTVRVYATVTDATGVDSVTADLSAFGAGSSVALYSETDASNGKDWDGDSSDESDVYGADVPVDSNSASEGEGQSATITAEDSSSNTNSDTTSEFGSLETDFTPPSITQPAITTDISDDSNGDEGVANPGDTIRVEWDNSADGDNNADVSSVSVDMSAFGGSADVTASETSEGSNIYEATYTIDSNDDIDSTGLTASVSATDDAGNQASQPDDDTVSVDSNSPSFDTSSATATSDGAIDVAWSLSSTDGDTFNLYRENDSSGNGFTELATDVSSAYADSETEHGVQYSYKVEAVDDAGNAVNSSTVSATADSEAPSISYNSPTGFVITDSPEISLDLSDDVSEVDTSTIDVTITDVNGEAFSQTGTGSGVTHDGSTLKVDLSSAGINLAEGDVEVVVNVDDSAGNSNSTTETGAFTVDTEAPTVNSEDVEISDNSDSNGIVAEGDEVLVEINATDDTSGIDTVSVDTSSFNSNDSLEITETDSESASDYTATFIVGSKDADSATVSVSATDEATNGGSQGTASTSSLEVDNTAPTVSTQSVPTDPASIITGEVDVEGYFSSGASDVQNKVYEYKVSDSEGFQVVQDSNTSGFDTTEFSDGDTVKFRANFTDKAGNTGSAKTSELTVDNQAPVIDNVEISDSADGNGVVADGESVSVAVNVTEEYSGISQVTGDASAFDPDAGLTLSTDTDSSSDYTGSFTVGTPGDGEKTVSVSATDRVSNGGSQAVEANNLTVDNSAPTVQSAAYRDSNSDGTVDKVDVEFSEPVSYTASDTVSNDWSVSTGSFGSFSIDGEAAVDGSTVTLTVSADSGVTGVSATGTEPGIDYSTSGTDGITDDAGNEASATSEVSMTDEANPSITLNEGTNLVSFAVSDSSEYSVSEVLKEDETDEVWKRTADGWKVWTPEKSDSMNFNIRAGEGYLVESSSSYTVTPEIDEGTLENPFNSQIQLGEGWNLVGHYDEAPETRSNVLSALSSNVAQVWKNTGSGSIDYNKLASGSNFQPGNAYWVKTSSDLSGGSVAYGVN